MYHLCELQYGKEKAYTITNNVMHEVEKFMPVGAVVKSVFMHHDFDVVKGKWLDSCKVLEDQYPEKKPHLLVDNVMHYNIFEAVLALDKLGPRLLGWRVRRFGNRLGLLGGYLRRRRQARRSRRRERRLLRAERRAARHKKFWAMVRWILCLRN